MTLAPRPVLTFALAILALGAAPLLVPALSDPAMAEAGGNDKDQGGGNDGPDGGSGGGKGSGGDGSGGGGSGGDGSGGDGSGGDGSGDNGGPGSSPDSPPPSEPEPEPEPKPEPKPAPEPEPNPEPAPQPEPQPQPAPETDRPAFPQPQSSGGGDGSVVPIITRPDPARLMPYADALLRVRRLRADLAAAEAAMARLSSMGPRALSRAYPLRSDPVNREALERDRQRLAGADRDYLRLKAMDAADRARFFPSDTGGHDEAAYDRALRQALKRARDLDTLTNLSPERMADLYPAQARGGHDRAAHRAALAQAQARVETLRAAITRAEAEAQTILAATTGGGALSRADIAYVQGYVGG